MAIDSKLDLSLPVHKRRLAKRADCGNGLYISPAQDARVDSAQKVPLVWDKTCFDGSTSAVDIYITAPYNVNPDVVTFYDTPNTGTLDAELKPKYWNSTATVVLSLNIVPAGTPPFLNIAGGPTWTATYDSSVAVTNTAAAAAANTAIPEDPYVTMQTPRQGGLTKGQLGAAILMPLLAIFGGLAFYVYRSRMKERTKRQRWSQAVDKRMSTISTDWKSMSGAAANHAIRHSMAISADRATKTSSFFAASGPRPSSVFTNGEPGQAGVGARYNGTGLGGNLSNPEMSTLRRPDGIASNPSARVSRVSFAADVHPRPSMGDSLRTSVYSRTSRAYHRGTVYEEEAVPPLPSPQRPEDGDIEMSPTQTQGAAPLTPAEIRAKIGTVGGEEGRPSVDEGLLRLPAMTLMRTSDASNDLVLSPTTPVNYPVLKTNVTGSSAAPSASSAAQPSTNSMFSGMTSFQTTSPDTMVSPDALLKAYAASKKTSMKAPKRQPTIPTTSLANGGMKILYEPQQATAEPAQMEESPYGEDAYSYYGAGTGHGHTDSYATEEGVVSYAQRSSPAEQQDTNPFRKSQAVSRAYSQYSEYSGVDPEHPFRAQ